ncbi:hypothetical protein AMS68_005283 [Peltaster fructicola]|uniref:SHSP domain-containing protein n=1 Tax=Peltaster fructicola TaxID=286661 RepID=A0A6H0XYL3_9PEZI|nr:hypothetical protein AMS68_005283 [Peltaster fructicola]
MSLFPRFVTHDLVVNDFAPVWRLLDNYANQVASARQQTTRQERSFNPRFDVKETEAGYELKGELPGVEQSNIEIEFRDQRTIVIKGSSEHSKQESQPAQPEKQAVEDATPHEVASHRATVEDEPEYVDAAADSATETSSATAAEATPTTTSATPQVKPVEQQPTTPASRYWVSERHTGQFQRVFSFPAPVDTENTTARLRNGVLEVVVPKVPKAGIKRISIE